jgi:cell wall-associated NlpC family hydrolase
MIAGIDLDALAKPLVDLVASFGTGVMPNGGPSDALRRTSTALDGIHQAGSAGINQMTNAWNGGAGDRAMDKAMQVQTSAAAISDRGNDMADVVGRAAATVQTGQRKLAGILQDFVHQVNMLGPAATTPMGLTTVVSSAIDHFGQAVGVVGQVRSDLDTHTASMTQLTPPPSTPSLAGPPVNPASFVPQLGSGVELASSVLGGVVSAGGSALGSLTSTASTGAAQSASAVSAASPNGDGKPGQHGGVMLTLPDGTQVEAPNQRAATAVKAAIGCCGTPYVWGGNTPGRGLDCSGLTKWAYAQAGVDLPRLAADQSQGATPVSPGDVMPGDLAIWDGHVAMVVGDGKMVEAGDPVQIDPIRTENMGMAFHGFYRPAS